MSSADFRALAKELMSPSEAVLLDYCTLDPDPPVPEGTDPGQASGAPPASQKSTFIKRWKEWERALRLCLAKNRALKIKREGTFDAPDFPSDAVAAAKNAVSIESPLEAELFLDKARWDAIENFQGMNIFNESAMYAYMLKLLLMERRMALKTEEGFVEYKGLYAAILGEVK